MTGHAFNMRLDRALMFGCGLLLIVGTLALDRALAWFERVYLD